MKIQITKKIMSNIDMERQLKSYQTNNFISLRNIYLNVYFYLSQKVYNQKHMFTYMNLYCCFCCYDDDGNNINLITETHN